MGINLRQAVKTDKFAFWDPATGKQVGKTLVGHKKWITWLCWKPMHLDPESWYFASSSKRYHHLYLGHQTVPVKVATVRTPVTSVKWGGTDLLHSSQDRKVKLWGYEDAGLCRALQGHGHWVSTTALGTENPCLWHCQGNLSNRNSCWNQQRDEKARIRHIQWSEGNQNQNQRIRFQAPMTLHCFYGNRRLTGHQQPINEVLFSPNRWLVASASFAKSVKLWDRRTGKFLVSLRGHVQHVYQVAWSSDSHLLGSDSADSTLNVWDMKARKLLYDLPGHSAEVESSQSEGGQWSVGARTKCWNSGENILPLYLLQYFNLSVIIMLMCVVHWTGTHCMLPHTLGKIKLK